MPNRLSPKTLATAPTGLAAATLLATALALAATSMPAAAATEPPPVKKTAKPAKKTKANPAKVQEPDTVGSIATDFNCDSGGKLTIHKFLEREHEVVLNWRKKLYKMLRVTTSTGAHRFEHQATGLVWIGIPAKGILLDAKKGQQLANDCKSPEQLKPPVPEAAPPAPEAAPPVPQQAAGS